MHVVKYYALAPVDSAAEALESYELLSDSLPAISDSFPDQPYSRRQYYETGVCNEPRKRSCLLTY